MKKITTLYAVAALAALSLAGQAFAMGGSMMQGSAGGGNRNMGSHMQRNGTTGMQHGSGNGSRHEVMHETDAQRGSMNAAGQQHMMNNGVNVGPDTQSATLTPVTTQPVRN